MIELTQIQKWIRAICHAGQVCASFFQFSCILISLLIIFTLLPAVIKMMTRFQAIFTIFYIIQLSNMLLRSIGSFYSVHLMLHFVAEGTHGNVLSKYGPIILIIPH